MKKYVKKIEYLILYLHLSIFVNICNFMLVHESEENNFWFSNKATLYTLYVVYNVFNFRRWIWTNKIKVIVDVQFLYDFKLQGSSNWNFIFLKILILLMQRWFLFITLVPAHFSFHSIFMCNYHDDSSKDAVITNYLSDN